MKKTLWTPDFTRMSVSTMLSVIGGEALNLPLSFLVFKSTGSPFLSALIFVLGMLPDTLLGIAVAPFVDKADKKKILVAMDLLAGCIYLASAWYAHVHDFSYMFYVGFTLVTATISMIYNLSFEALYPSTIPEGMEQKGYAIDSAVYPVVTAVVSPLFTWIYTQTSMPVLFIITAVCALGSIPIEAGIKAQFGPSLEDDLSDNPQIQSLNKQDILSSEQREKSNSATINEERIGRCILSIKPLQAELAYISITIHDYVTDLKEGFAYMKREAGVRNITWFRTVLCMTGEPFCMIDEFVFQLNPLLGITKYSIFMSTMSIARIFSAGLVYKKEVAVEKRYPLCRMLHLILGVVDTVFLLLPYPVMLLCGAYEGAAGNYTYTLRNAGWQRYIPEQMRARLASINNTLGTFATIVCTALVGAIGELSGQSYVAMAICLGIFETVMCIALLWIPSSCVAAVYAGGSINDETCSEIMTQ